MFRISFLIIILISIFVFYPTFNLALFGDDWLAFFRYKQHVDPGSEQWNHLTYYLTPYGPQDILMGMLQKIFHYESGYYYMLSFIFRITAAFSFYPLVYYLTKSKLAVFFTILFFSITTIGLDTTNWVFNMPSYITIALFNLFLYFFLKSREEKKIKLLIFGAILYYLAYVTTPIRMHGSLLFIFFIEVFWVFQSMKLKVAKMATLRFFIILMVFLIIRFAGQSQGPPQEPVERFMIGLKTDLQLLEQDKFDFIFNPIVMFGSMLIPDLILPFNSQNLKVFLLFVGACVFLLTIYLLIKFFISRASTGLFIGLAWSILSFFFAWWWVPQSIFPTTYRYLIVSAVGVTILLATIISLGKGRRAQLSLFILLLPLIILHIISTRMYINNLLQSHSQEITNKIWDKVPHIPEVGKTKEPLIFYFEGDGINGAILHNVITFGFPPHMALLYNVREGDRTPVPMSDFREVISAVKDGQSFKAYGFPQKPIPLDRVFAFHLQGKDNLINITDLVRQKLQQI